MVTVRVGITGLSGFIGSHLRDRLRREEKMSVLPFEDSFFDDSAKLREFLGSCDVVVHLAAMNRGDANDLYNVNVELVNNLVSQLEEIGATPHVVFSSSTQVELDNAYGRSKKEGARILQEWANRNGAPLSVMIIPNVFGDGGRPFHNSVVATFCHQLTHYEQPQIQQDNELSLIYINELTEIMRDRVKNPPDGVDVVRVQPSARKKVSEVLALLESFKEHHYDKRTVPHLANAFERNLFNTFLTYMEDADYERTLTLHSDGRGSLFEVVKQQCCSQIFFSTSKPRVTRGNHYHTRKMEKFCVVQGEAIIRLRRIGTDKVLKYQVSGESPAIIEIPIFHTHNIENVGTTDLLTLFWTNELFDPNDSDTFFEKV